MKALAVIDLTKKFDTMTAVDNLSFEIGRAHV